MSLNKSTNIKFSDFRNEFFVNKTFTPIKCSDFYPTNNLNTADIPNIPNLPVANSSMKLSYFKSVGKTLFNITISGTESTIKTIPQPSDDTNNNGNFYYLRLLHQGSTNTSTIANYTEYTIRFPYTIITEVLLVGGGGGGGAGFNNYMYGGGGHPGEYKIGEFTFNENQIYKIRIGAGGLGMQSSLDTTTIDGTSCIIYDNVNTPLLTSLGGKRGNNILYYSLNTITSTSNVTSNITITTSVTNILIPLRANIIYNYTDTIINNMNIGSYNVTFTNGSINVATLPSNKSYPILKTGSTILSPLLWYKFDNSLINSGSLGNLYDIINNGSAAFSTSSYIKGSSSLSIAGGAYTNAYVTIPNGTLNFNAINTANGISFSLWIYTFSSTSINYIFYFGTLTTGGLSSRNISLLKTGSNTFIARIQNPPVDGNASTATDRTDYNINVTIPNSSWVHLVWTISYAGVWTIYTNTNSISTSITQKIPQFTISNKNYNIGKQLNLISESRFDGLIDDFRIYDFHLTQSQVNELYNGRVDISYTSDVYVTTEFTYTNDYEIFTIPNGVKFINIYCWGAGGGGSAAVGLYNTTPGGYGGDGGFVMGTLDVTTITSLRIIVGQGGRKGIQAARCGYAFGGGGDAGNIGDYNWAAGGGGGLSGVFSSVYITENGKNIETYSIPIIIAGGGGASALNNSKNGGNAGGLIGNNGEYVPWIDTGGYGGTQTAGGNGNLSGTKFNGGSCSGYGGGGGGGYYGGGASMVNSGLYIAAGGGGSSYINTSQFSFTNTSIPNAKPNGTRIVNGNTNKYYKNNAGLGANVGLNNGNDGLIVIEYLLNSNIIYGSGNGGNNSESIYKTNANLINATDLNNGTGGNGANAFSTNITGSILEYYAAGGGGSSYLGPVGLGGIGASGVYLGGNGTNNSSAIKISHAVANTGSGGGGSACDGANASIGGNGSAGICIIKYRPFIDYPPTTTLNFTSTLISPNKYNITINTLNYVVNFSSLSGTNYPYFLLDRSAQSWITATTYNSSGIYKGSAYLADVNYKGEWVYYKFPYSIALYSYDVVSLSSSGYPLLWKIYGSNDETNWEEITEASNNQIEVDGRSFNKILNVLPTPYKYIGIVINKVKFLNSADIYLYLTGFFVNGRVHNLTNLLLDNQKIYNYTYANNDTNYINGGNTSYIYSFTLSNNKTAIINTLNFNININDLEYGDAYDMGIIVFQYFLNDVLIYNSNGEIDPIYDFGYPPTRRSFNASTTLTNLNININANQQQTFYCKIFINGYNYYGYNNNVTYTTLNFTLSYLM